MADFIRDLRYSFRILWRSPGFTIVAVLALALGIGANTAIFSLVNGVLLNALPYDDADRVVAIWETNEALGIKRTGPSGPNFIDWRDQSTVFESMTLIQPGSGTIVGLGEPEQLPAMRVTAGLLPLVGAGMAKGRWFTPDEGLADNVVVLGYDYWQNRLGGDPNIIGRKLKADGLMYETIGVASPDLWSPVPSEAYVPWNDQDLRRQDRLEHEYGVLARLKPGVTVAQAQEELSLIYHRITEGYPELRGFDVTVVRLEDAMVEGIRRPLMVLLAAVAFVLLIACANVANLLLARMSSRRREVAMRTALGAGRARVVRQMLTESLLLASMGGVVGLLFALWGVEFLRTLLPGTIPVPDASVEMLLASVEVDYTVLGFTVLVSLFTGALFGLAPILYALRENVGGLLKESSRGTSSGVSQGRLRDALVVGEVALALILLIGAGLMMTTFRNLMDVKTGFQPAGVLTLQMELPTDSKYQTGPERSDFLRSVLTELETIPGIESAGLTGVLPLEARVDQTGFLIEDDPPLPDGARQLIADYSEVSADYFATMRIPLVRGRYFTNSDDRDHRGAAIISESLARRHFSDRDPIGHRLQVDDSGPWEIVGVVGDIHHEGLDKSPQPTIYLPYFQRSGNLMTIVARTAGDPQSLVRPIKEAVWRVDNEQPLYRIRTMAEVVEQSRSTPRLTVILLGSMAGLALLMAAVGIYGVLSYSISQRRREIGVRIAVGARSVDVFTLILRKSLTLAGVGVIIGLVVGSLLSRAMGNLLFEVRATDPFVLGTVALGLMAVAALAGFLPARRAAKVDPVITLRYE